MNNLLKWSFLTLFIFLFGCSETETKEIEISNSEFLTPEVGTLPNDYNHSHGHDDFANATNAQFGPNSYWTSTFVNSTETRFLRTQHNQSASLFGLNNVPLYLAGGPGTNNAFSYSQGYVIWGEQLFKRALRYGRAAIAYVAAHEIGHQIQFRQGLPSVSGASNRELQADGFAGYYLRKRYTSTWSVVIPAYNFAQTIAGANGSSHGTSRQRRSALRLGWWLARRGNLSNRQIDSNFFYYYNSYVLPGKGKSIVVIEPPMGINSEFHQFMLTKVKELSDIYSGKISEEEFKKLSND